MSFMDCPGWLDAARSRRCGLPAVVRSRYALRSAGGGLVECARIRCPRGHWFNGPVADLIIPPASNKEEASSS